MKIDNVREKTVAGVIFLVVHGGWNLADTSGRDGIRSVDTFTTVIGKRTEFLGTGAQSLVMGAYVTSNHFCFLNEN